jgi:hypothetical protein
MTPDQHSGDKGSVHLALRYVDGTGDTAKWTTSSAVIDRTSTARIHFVAKGYAPRETI